MKHVMPPIQFALEIRGLVKRFDRPAVDSLDLTVRSGEFYAAFSRGDIEAIVANVADDVRRSS